MIVKSEFTEKGWNKMEQTGLNVAASAKASYAIVASGGVSIGTSTEEENRRTFEETRYHKSESYVGSRPPSDGRWQTWAQNVGDSPYPVKYTLAPLTSLLDGKFFPNMPPNELTTRRSLLTEAYESYCGSVQGCETPGPDRVPVRVQSVASSFSNEVYQSCPNSAAHLLSCGIGGVQRPGTGVKPYTSNSCKCTGQATHCESWCTNKAIDTAIAHSYHSSGWATASCPSGYKVRTH